MSSTVSSSSEELTAWLISPRARSFLDGTRELLRACLQLLEQVRIVDRDHRLVRKRAQEHRRVAEGAGLRTLHGEHPEKGIVPEQRHGEQRAPAHGARRFSKTVFRVRQHVWNFDHAAGHDASSSGGSSIERKRGAAPFRPPFLVETVERRRAKLDVLQLVDDTPVGAAEPDRAFDQPPQDHIERARGAPDDQLERFAQSSLPGQCVDERVRPFLGPLLRAHHLMYSPWCRAAGTHRLSGEYRLMG